MADIDVRFMHPIDDRVVTVTMDSDMTAQEAINELLANQFIQPNNFGYQLAVKGGAMLPAEAKFKDAGLTEESVVRIIPCTSAGGGGSAQPHKDQIRVMRELVKSRIDPNVYDEFLSGETDRKLKVRFAFIFLALAILFTICSYTIIVLNAIFEWHLGEVAITALVLQTPVQFIGLLYIIARNLFPQNRR